MAVNNPQFQINVRKNLNLRSTIRVLLCANRAFFIVN